MICEEIKTMQAIDWICLGIIVALGIRKLWELLPIIATKVVTKIIKEIEK